MKRQKFLKILSFALIALMVSAMHPFSSVAAWAATVAAEPVAKIGDTSYESLSAAVDAVTAVNAKSGEALPAATTIVLQKSTACGFDVGTSNGQAAKNIVLDLNGYTLTTKPSVGSVNTVTNGIRVLAYSALEIKNGSLVFGEATEDNIKVGIANYGTAKLDSVTVTNGPLVQYPINNRGTLTLSGTTTVPNGTVAPNDYAENNGVFFAITCDPYTAVYPSPLNASVTVSSAGVTVGNVQLERYSAGKIELNLTAGTYGQFYKDTTNTVTTITCSHYSKETRNAVAATCTADGATGDVYCKICGEKLTASTVVTHTGHKAAAELKNVKAATTDAEGYTGDTVCAVCGEVLYKGTAIAKLAANQAAPVVPQQQQAAIADSFAAEIASPAALAASDSFDSSTKTAIAAALDKGATVGVDVVAVPKAENTVSDADKALIAAAVGSDTKVAQYLDFSVKVVNRTDNTTLGNMVKLDTVVLLSATVPAGERVDGMTYRLARLHDGKVTILKGTYDPATGVVTGESDSFSTYALVYEPTNPKTGDASGTVLWTSLAALAVMAVAVTAVSKKKCACKK